MAEVVRWLTLMSRVKVGLRLGLRVLLLWRKSIVLEMGWWRRPKRVVLVVCFGLSGFNFSL